MLKDKIKWHLAHQRKTVKELAVNIGMTDQAIRNIYKRDSCELSTLRKIAEFFGVPVSDLLEEHEVRVIVRDNNHSFNPGQNDPETIQKLTHIIDEQRMRIDSLTDKLLKNN